MKQENYERTKTGEMDKKGGDDGGEDTRAEKDDEGSKMNARDDDGEK